MFVLKTGDGRLFEFVDSKEKDAAIAKMDQSKLLGGKLYDVKNEYSFEQKLVSVKLQHQNKEGK